MSAFRTASAVEAEGLAILIPFAASLGVQLVPTNQHGYLQKVYGDFIARWKTGKCKFVEVKVEREHTGNLFIESWSNRSHGTHGWLDTCRANWFWYYFLESDSLYCFELPRLREWLFDGRIERYRFVRQGKYDQINDTWGYLVPVADLELQPWFHGPKKPKEDTTIFQF